MKRIQKWQKSNRREFISTWDAELLELKASPVLNFQCNLCPVQVTHPFLPVGVEELSSISRGSR